MMMIQEFCAGGLVFFAGKLVILRRFNGVWLFPKGHIDPGETPEIAAIREVWEESGLSARIIGKLDETSYTFSEHGDKHFKTVSWFLMETDSDRIALEKQFFNDGQWISEEQIAILSFSADQELASKAFHLYRQRKEIQQ
jgi:diadenosine hexaphosphate hydrolase (ATP-forming)